MPTEVISDALEMELLRDLFRRPEALLDVVRLVHPEDFRVYANQCIYRRMVELWDRRLSVDVVTVADALKKAGELEDVTYPYLGAVVDSSSTGNGAEHHARLVRDRAILRRLEVAAEQIGQAARNPTGPAEQILADAERAIMALAAGGVDGTARPVADVVADLFDRIDACRAGNREAGVPTGFADLDNLLVGLQPSELILLAARPAVGKTALGALLADRAARAGHPTLFISLEMGGVEVVGRMLSALAPVDGQLIRQAHLLQEKELAAIHKAGDTLRQGRLWISDMPGQTMLRIASEARRIQHRHGLGLVVIDYLQLIEPEDRKVPRHEQVGAISRRLKALARELRAPVLALAQLNRASEERAEQTPRLSDLRESGSLEQDADVVLLLSRLKNPDLVGVQVAKNRNGPTGGVTLRFERKFSRFTDTDGSTPFEMEVPS
jgi:replicative DNA helicase